MCVLPLCVAALATAPSAGQADLPEIWRAFAARQAAAETIEVRWSQTLFRPGKAIAREAATALRGSSARLDQSKVPDEAPPDLTAGPYDCRVLLAGPDRFRCEKVVTSYVQQDRGVYRPVIQASDGEAYWHFLDMSETEFHSGGSVRDATPVRWDGTPLAGLAAVLRPLRAEAFGPTPQGWTLRPERVPVGGRECVVIEKVTGHGTKSERARRAYLDPATDYLPVRLTDEFRRDGSPLGHADLSYERAEEPTWMPSRWTAARYAPVVGLAEQSENEVVTAALGVEIPEDAFRIDFPEGTVVADLRGAAGPRRPPAVSVVAADGSLVPRRQYVAEQTRPRDRSWMVWLVIAAAALAGAGGLTWRRRAA